MKKNRKIMNSEKEGKRRKKKEKEGKRRKKKEITRESSRLPMSGELYCQPI
jgi:hypothetical protein